MFLQTSKTGLLGLHCPRYWHGTRTQNINDPQSSQAEPMRNSIFGLILTLTALILFIPTAAGKRTRVTNQFTHPALCVFEDGYRQCAARPIAEPPH